MRVRRREEQTRGLLRSLVFLSVPTILEEILATLLQYVDTAMVGQLGEQATASVSIRQREPSRFRSCSSF